MSEINEQQIPRLHYCRIGNIQCVALQRTSFLVRFNLKTVECVLYIWHYEGGLH